MQNETFSINYINKKYFAFEKKKHSKKFLCFCFRILFVEFLV